MGNYTFRWPHNASEVYVTGTFDDWGKTVQLEKKGDVFEKEVHLPSTEEKLHYKFVVDGTWTTDTSSPEEDDGSNNINNVLYPDQVQNSAFPSNGAAIMSGVTPDSTTAGLAGKVPREVGENTISSAAPGSTTAELAKDVPMEQRTSVPGGFPDTPGTEAETFSVNPIPASSGLGNPIHLKPGEKVPDPSTFNPNTVHSTARTDQAAYETGPSATLAGVQTNSSAPGSKNIIPESGLAMGEASQYDPATIQSAAPNSTTAGLAAAVPLESQRQTTSQTAAQDVPNVVKNSLSEAHKDPEAAANEEVVEEKKEVENELQKVVQTEDYAGTPGPAESAALTATAPGATLGEQSKAEPSDGPTVTTGAAAAKAPAVSKPTGKPASQPTHDDQSKTEQPKTEPSEGPVVTTGAAAAKAPAVSKPSESPAPRATGEEEPVSESVSPRATTPTREGPTVTTGVAAANTSEVTEPAGAANKKATEGDANKQATEGDAKKQATESGANKKTDEGAAKSTEPSSAAKEDQQSENGTKSEKKKKNRASGFFQKLKEKLK